MARFGVMGGGDPLTAGDVSVLGKLTARHLFGKLGAVGYTVTDSGGLDTIVGGFTVIQSTAMQWRRSVALADEAGGVDLADLSRVAPTGLVHAKPPARASRVQEGVYRRADLASDFVDHDRSVVAGRPSPFAWDFKAPHRTWIDPVIFDDHEATRLERGPHGW